MSTGDLWELVVGTAVGVGMLIGVFAVKVILRKHLVSRSEEPDRGRAMVELLALQAKLQKDASGAEGPRLVCEGSRVSPTHDDQVPGQGPEETASGRGGRGVP